jgi:bifunctional UDP-N-acetylglucosamine pyrophosphorylase / glucosamine-1-phosphate N-acetyltransferase
VAQIDKSLAAVILAAGQGVRMRSTLPKVLHPVAGQPMIGHVLDTVRWLSPARTIAILAPGADAVAAAVPEATPIIQTEPKGTGDAVLRAKDALAGFDGEVLIIFGDTPLASHETMKAMVDACRDDEVSVVVLGFDPLSPDGYGRLVLADDGTLAAIVEHRDATPEQLEIGLCNSGMMVVDAKVLFDLLGQVTSDNAKGEFYLTDIIALAKAQNLVCDVVMGDEDEVMGVNSRADLANAETIAQDRLREQAMIGGATLIDPATVTLSFDTVLGSDVLIEPNVIFGPGVTVGDNVTIKGFSHMEGATIGDGASVGPFARLRPGTEIGKTARVGNFVETKNAKIADGAKASHLSYLGDATIGEGANIGAGTITCNYDGFSKSITEIGAGAFIGSNTALVAPVRVGAGAVIGAGSVITNDVQDDALALTRVPKKEIESWAGKRRENMAKSKKET